MAGTEVGSGYVSILPSMKGFSSKLSAEAGGAGEKAGREGGNRFGRVFASTSIAPMRAIGAAAVGLFAVDKVVGFFKESIAGARESAKIGALTAQVIKTTGAAANISAEQVGKLATSISNKTGVDDEAVQSGSNLLLTFTKVRNEVGKGNDIFNQATMAATDMSVALGTDVKSASMLLGKALNDPVKGMTALTRSGVSFTQAQKDQVKAMVKAGDTMGAQKLILAEMTTQFGGAAAAAGTPADRARVAWGNFQEMIGAKLLPVMDKLSTFATGTLLPGITAMVDAIASGETKGKGFAGFMSRVGVVLSRIGKFISGTIVPGFKSLFSAIASGKSDGSGFQGVMSEIGVVVNKLGTFLTETVIPAVISFGQWLAKYEGWLTPIAAGVGAVVAAMRVWAFITGVVKAATAAYTAVQAALNVVMMLNPIGLVVLAVIALVAIFVVAYKKSETFRNIIQGAWNGIKAAASAVADWFTGTLWPALQAVWDGIVSGVSALWDGIAAAWNGIKSAASAVWGAIVAVIRGYINAYRTVVMAVFNAVKSFIAAVWNGIKAAASAVWGAIVAVVTAYINRVKAVINGIAVIVGKIRTWFGQAKDAIADKLGAAVAFVKGIPGKIIAALGNVGSMLRESGSKIIQGLIDGIKSMAGNVKNAISGVLKKARDLLPFSPAKEGPFSGKGWTLYSGRSISESLAEGIRQRAHLARSAALDLVAGAQVGPARLGVAGGSAFAGAALGSAGGGAVNNWYVTSNAKDPVVVAKEVQAENAWSHR